MDEFGLISRYFAPLEIERDDIVLGIGDDAAVLDIAAPARIVVAVDTLVEGVHFPAGMAAEAVGYRTAAVNLSDIAAMGAVPRYATLALSLPAADEAWLSGFAHGLGDALRAAEVSLVGGDTTRGALTISLQLIGIVDGAPLTRGGARPGDLILVSGTLGDARAGLDVPAQGAGTAGAAWLRERYERPQPRLALGQALRPLAHAAIDVSDGLLADLGHVMRMSACRAEVELDALPLSPALRAHCALREAQGHALAGGDDYELALCVPPAAAAAAHACAVRAGVALTAIGRISAGAGVVCRDRDGHEVRPATAGYRHFS
jgi:thiamine-monophosphate kinase